MSRANSTLRIAFAGSETTRHFFGWEDTLKLYGVALALVLAGCGGDSDRVGSPTRPPTFTFTGTWIGSAQDSAAGNGGIRATLSQSGNTVTGTWLIQFPAAGFQNSGSVSGTTAGSSMTVVLEPSDPRTCPYRLTASGAGNQMTGTYAAFDCTVSVAGSIIATR